MKRLLILISVLLSFAAEAQPPVSTTEIQFVGSTSFSTTNGRIRYNTACNCFVFRYGGANVTPPLVAAPGAGQAGQSVRWNNGTTSWEYFTPASAFSLTNGSGTTANGTAVDLGGTVVGSPTITLPTTTNVFKIKTSGDGSFSDYSELQLIGSADGSDESIRMRLDGVDGFRFGGSPIAYETDLSAGFVARSIIDKGYADATYAPNLTYFRLNTTNTITSNTSGTLSSGNLTFSITGTNRLFQLGTDDTNPLTMTMEKGATNSVTQFRLQAAAASPTNAVRIDVGHSNNVAANSRGVDIYSLVSGAVKNRINLSETAITIQTSSGGAGAQYASDYSSDYTDRSLVDRGFVLGGTAANELLKSTGSAITASNLQSVLTANNVALSAIGSDTNISFDIVSKGTGSIDLISGAAGVNFSSPSASFSLGYLPGSQALGFSGSATGTITGDIGDITDNDGHDLLVEGGNAYPSAGNGIGGNLRLRGGVPNGSGAGGAVVHLGSVNYPISSTSTDIGLDYLDYTKQVDASGANRTITLPAATPSLQGRAYVILKIDASANTVTIDGNGADTISGTATKVISTQWAGYKIQCTGSAWVVIGTF